MSFRGGGGPFQKFFQISTRKHISGMIDLWQYAVLQHWQKFCFFHKRSIVVTEFFSKIFLIV